MSFGEGEERTAPRPAAIPIARAFALALAVLAALPFALTLVYRFVDPPSTLILADRLLGRPVDHRPVPIERISPAAVRAVVVSEDARFCLHHGVDSKAIDEAVARAERTGGRLGGVSTITMQVAKNLFLWPQRSWIRKALEVPLALWIDFVLPKRRVLEIYLNVAEWGPGTYGIDAGARRAFGHPASQITPREAALLATALPNPIRRDAARPTSLHRALAATIERRARAADPYLTCLGLPGA